MNLLESYKNRLAISESIHQKSHNGAKMSAQKKLMIAAVLNNTSKFMNEAFTSGDATQRGALHDYKKFCLNISTVALPNLILPELMLTQPMSSITGYVTYLRYTVGTPKNYLDNETVINSVYRLGDMTEDRINYTSDRVAETVEVSEDGSVQLSWFPVVNTDKVKAEVVSGATEITAKDADKGIYTVTGADKGAKVKVRYIYNNIVIPQNQIPTLKAEMDAIELHAHARRIAVYYSQIAAFQAKTDYGTDIGEQLAAQAQGELAYEIDTEGVMMLYKGAETDTRLEFKSYDVSTQASIISRSQYYEYFNEIIARAKQIIYKRTQKFAPNYMVVGTDVISILPYLKGWTAAPANTINGPYFAGTVDGLKVFVSPAIKANEFFFGVNGSDLQTSAAVYAPYMAIVPTQLLGFADGTMSQGFSTMYDMKLLSTYEGYWNTTKNKPIKDSKEGKFSHLLVKGWLVVDKDTKAPVDAEN